MAGGAVLIILGVALLNGGEQRGSKKMMKMGPMAFLLGWALVIYAMSIDSPTSYAATSIDVRGALALAGGMSIVAGVMLQKMAPPSLLKYKVAAGPLFIGGWLVMGLSASMKRGMKLSDVVSGSMWSQYINGCSAKIAGMSVAAILASMVAIMPNERAAAVTDGVGMPLFTAGWMGMAYAASM